MSADHSELAREIAELVAERLNRPQQVFTTVEAAEYLRVSRQFLEIARVKGGGPPYAKLSRAVRYRRVDLDDWLETSMRRHTADGGRLR